MNRQPVFISTADGGHEWTVLPVPFSDEFVSVACASPSNARDHSFGVGPSAIDGSEGASSQPGEVFVATSDGGRTWSSTRSPPAESVTSLACPSVSSCTVIGYSPSATLKGLVMSTSNGGATWRNGTLPAGFGFDYLSTLSCGDTTHCMAIGVVTVPNPDECGPDGQVPAGYREGCSSGATTVVARGRHHLRCRCRLATATTPLRRSAPATWRCELSEPDDVLARR